MEKKIRLEDLSNYSYDGIAEGYFEVDSYSKELKEKIEEYKSLAFKKDLNEDESARRMGGKYMNSIENDKNLLVIEAIEGFAFNHNISSSESLEIFNKYDLIKLIRSQYDVLHTQSLEESIEFVEDVVRRKEYAKQ